MRKLKLESLEVASFETTPSPPETRGTVQGHRALTDGCTILPGTARTNCGTCDPTEQATCSAGNPWANSCRLCWVSENCTINPGPG